MDEQDLGNQLGYVDLLGNPVFLDFPVTLHMFEQKYTESLFNLGTLLNFIQKNLTKLKEWWFSHNYQAIFDSPQKGTTKLKMRDILFNIVKSRGKN